MKDNYSDSIGNEAYLVDKFGPLDGDEVDSCMICGRLGQQGFAAAGRAAEQHARWFVQAKVRGPLRVINGQADCLVEFVPDGTQGSDVVVSDAWHGGVALLQCHGSDLRQGRFKVGPRNYLFSYTIFVERPRMRVLNINSMTKCFKDNIFLRET